MSETAWINLAISIASAVFASGVTVATLQVTLKSLTQKVSELDSKIERHIEFHLNQK